MRTFAEHLVAHETRDNNSSRQTSSPATFPICGKLRPSLAALVGNTGFGALLSRALALASPEVPWLRALHVTADGSLEVPAELKAQVDPEKMAEGRVVLLGKLLGLLIALIGETLTMQLMREVWPKLILDDLCSGDGDGNESNT
jgi:hypothetical protein